MRFLIQLDKASKTVPPIDGAIRHVEQDPYTGEEIEWYIEDIPGNKLFELTNEFNQVRLVKVPVGSYYARAYDYILFLG